MIANNRISAVLVSTDLARSQQLSATRIDGTGAPRCREPHAHIVCIGHKDDEPVTWPGPAHSASLARWKYFSGVFPND
jgi:hypothetical protein